jgi:hypothetical protein
MGDAKLQEVANAVVRRAQRTGYVLPRDVRAELAGAGLPEEQWKEVVELAGDALQSRQGRFYHAAGMSPNLQKAQEQQRAIQKSVRGLIRHYRAATRSEERRQQDRIDFIQPVQVQTEDNRQFTLLSRDLSITGIRLVGTKRLLGQKVRVTLPQGDKEPCTLLVRILWTCAVADDLFENGGTFTELIDQPKST